jgi:tRNA nucleotidyltransferase (CCA-adding enzyme)
VTISEAQLQTWTNAPGSTKLQYTHEAVRNALSASSALRARDYDVYLQGSYANSTNIRADSDVDIVVQLNSTFTSDTSRLNLQEQLVYNAAFPAPATYRLLNFRADVMSALIAYFGQSTVRSGRSCIKLAGNASRVNADVVSCIQHRKFQSFNALWPNNFIEGMRFCRFDTGVEIINYPKIHIQNGEAKNATYRTAGKYKHLVRILKNIRRKLIEDGGLNPGIAPSYFMECAVYDVPDDHFDGDYQTSLSHIFDHLLQRCNPGTMVTVSHQDLLFGSEPWQWNQQNASTFFRASQHYYLIS